MSAPNPLKLEVDKTYESASGQLAYIMGPVLDPDKPDSYWSLQGFHYSSDGRQWDYATGDYGGTPGPFLWSHEHHTALVREVPTYPGHVGLAQEWTAKQRLRTRGGNHG